jgi:hypothetical protein
MDLSSNIGLTLSPVDTLWLYIKINTNNYVILIFKYIKKIIFYPFEISRTFSGV